MSKAEVFNIHQSKWHEDGLVRYTQYTFEKADVKVNEVAPFGFIKSNTEAQVKIIYTEYGKVSITIDKAYYELVSGCFCFIPQEKEYVITNVDFTTAKVLEFTVFDVVGGDQCPKAQEPDFFDMQEARWQTKDNEPGIRSAISKKSNSATLQIWEITPDGYAPFHHHEACQLIYIQHGNSEVDVDGKPFDLTAGCFIFVPGGVEHRVANKGTSTVINVDLFLPARNDRIDSEKVRDLGHKNWK